MYSERRKRYTSIAPFLPSENKRLSVCNIEQHSLQIDNNMLLRILFIMFGNDICTRVKRSENKKMAEIAQFLHENDLSVDTTVEVFITVTRDEKLIACGGIAGNIIKCVMLSVNPFAVKDWR